MAVHGSAFEGPGFEVLAARSLEGIGHVAILRAEQGACGVDEAPAWPNQQRSLAEHLELQSRKEVDLSLAQGPTLRGVPPQGARG